MTGTIEIKDETKALEVVLGAAPYEHYINVNGKPWRVVRALEVGMDANNPGDTMLTFSCFLDGGIDLVGNLKVGSPGLGRNTIAVELRLDGLNSRCAFDGKAIHFTKARLYADATEDTVLEIERLIIPTGNNHQPTYETVKGVFTPMGEQKITRPFIYED